MRSALITGITGQDGSYLAELLLSKGYRVVGFGRRASIHSSKNIALIRDQLEFAYGDLQDPVTLISAIRKYSPDEIYNLASQSHPGDSWYQSIETAEANALGAHHLYDAVREIKPDLRIYQASSSEMYGEVLETPQSETTPFNPVNPYAVAKVYAHQMAGVYRKGHGMFIACGILFNHESPRRSMRFITQKVTYGAACAKLNVKSSPLLNEEGEPVVNDGKLSLGNLLAHRDWGYAPDYVRAMWLMLQQEHADDFVIGTGISRSIKDLCDAAYRVVGLDWREHVECDERFIRPVETGATVANPAKATKELGWEADTTFEEMVKIMVERHLGDLGNFDK